MRSDAEKTAERRKIFSGSAYERKYSYARAVLHGRNVLISGTTGYDYPNDVLAKGASEQTKQIFRNVLDVLSPLGADLGNVLRLRIYIARVEDYEAVMNAFAEAFRGIDPACTTVQVGLFDPDILVEIDVDAVLDAVA
ncbi:RidA family protein [Agrobacterium vitis]|uniref:Rid family hydrolase n=1 Tax=Agrobacterium vitis TaxID=373 RepID=UPI001F29578A|nr:Rid family hydrolase [Agrobacterium vitis]MCF1467521.1 RidA family protein [Agrobacterium vitis]